jgi:hypothetical protein
MDKLVALYKTFSGHEFLKQSIESIYDYCNKIIFVNSDISWNGDTGNTVIPILEQWKKLYDVNNKIVSINGSWTSQEEQYNIGFNFIKKNFKEIPFILLIDSDEVYEKIYLDKLLGYLNCSENKDYDRFTCRMFTYIKYVNWQIYPIEPCCPTIVVKNNLKNYIGVRGDGLEKRKHFDDIYFHHYCYVRDSEDSIKRKFFNSQIGDKNPSNDWDNWYENKWLKLPEVEDFHPTKGREYCWKKIIII